MSSDGKLWIAGFLQSAQWRVTHFNHKKTLKTLKEEEGNIFEKGLIKTKDEK